MASTPRRFVEHVPVAITQRCVLRLKLLREPEIKHELARLMAANLERCGVRLLGWNIGPSNHFHWILSQSFSGHDRNRERGIASFMRNVTSQLTRKVNSFYSIQGHGNERPYRSHNLTTPQDLLRSLAYLHGQQKHHRLPAGSEQHSSARVYTEGVADGLVTNLPAFWNGLGASSEARLRMMTQLITEIIDRALSLADATDEDGSPWKLATEATLSAHPQVEMGIDVTAGIDLIETFDVARDHQAAREALLAWEWPKIQFDPRRAPEPGDILTIIVDRWHTSTDPPWS